MSVRAYRIVKKEVAKDSSFNLWHDDKLIDFLKGQGSAIDEGYQEYLSEDGGGTVEVSVHALQKAIDGFPFERGDYRKKAIRADIAFAKKKGNNYVLYECF